MDCFPLLPKNADGSKVEDFEDCIIYDGDQELKAWVSIARYMESFEEGEMVLQRCRNIITDFMTARW